MRIQEWSASLSFISIILNPVRISPFTHEILHFAINMGNKSQVGSIVWILIIFFENLTSLIHWNQISSIYITITQYFSASKQICSFGNQAQQWQNNSHLPFLGSLFVSWANSTFRAWNFYMFQINSYIWNSLQEQEQRQQVKKNWYDFQASAPFHSSCPTFPRLN